MFVVLQRRPNVRGSVTLASADFADEPIFNDGWNFTSLSAEAEADLDILIDGVNEHFFKLLRNSTLLERLGHSSSSEKKGGFHPETTEALLKAHRLMDVMEEGYECKPNKKVLELCTSWDKCVPSIPQLPLDRGDLKVMLKDIIGSAQHISGTAKIGDVVDSRDLAVKGV